MKGEEFVFMSALSSNAFSFDSEIVLISVCLILSIFLLISPYLLYKSVSGLISELVLIRKLPSKKNMRSLLRRLKNNQNLGSLYNKKIGLVLSGGGAKGAYEIGVLRALNKVGIHEFKAISGTSVGALNGVLVAQGSLQEATQIWKTMFGGKVLKARIAILISIIFRIIVIPYYLLHKNLFLWTEGIKYKRAIDSLALNDGVDFIEYFIPKVVSIFVGAIGVAGVILIYAFIYYWKGGTHEDDILYILSLLYAPVLMLSIIISYYIILYFSYDWISEKLSIFSNKPLRDLIEKHCSPEKLRKKAVSTFVTHATKGVVVRRNNKIVERQDVGKKLFFRNIASTRNFTAKVQYIPVYHNLLSHPDQDIREYVLQSAALPEIFPRKVLSGKSVVDGGVVDNSPIIPIICQKDIDGIIVIYLDKKREIIQKRLEEEEGRLRDMAERIEIFPDDDELYDNIDVELEKRIVHSHPQIRKILPIEPSMHIGGFLTGTMNFLNYKSHVLMWLGYWDALNAIEKGWVDFKWWQPVQKINLGKNCYSCGSSGARLLSEGIFKAFRSPS